MLQDLFALGSDPQIVVSIIERNIGKMEHVNNVLDLCCGKGSSIINVVKRNNWYGKGIDLFQPFILEAQLNAIKQDLNFNVDFEVMDIREAVTKYKDYDLIFYGSDTESLGSETETLKKISGCLSPAGFIVYDTAYEKVKNPDKILEENSFRIIDKIIHDPESVKQINSFNTEKIRTRAGELTAKYPDKKELFTTYIKRQEEESKTLEEKFIFATFLIQPVNK